MPWRDQSGPGFRIPDPRAPIVSLGSWCIRGTAKFELAHVITWTCGQVWINVTSTFNHFSQNWPHKLQSDTCNLENFENTRVIKYLCYLNCYLIVVTSVNNCYISFILKELFTLFFNYSVVGRKGKSPTRWTRGSIYFHWNLLVWLSKLPTFLSSRAWNIGSFFKTKSGSIFPHKKKWCLAGSDSAYV